MNLNSFSNTALVSSSSKGLIFGKYGMEEWGYEMREDVGLGLWGFVLLLLGF